MATIETIVQPKYKLAALQDMPKAACFHCKEPIADGLLVFDDKSFCCEGCKTVYHILNDNDLVSYYSLDETAGVSQKHQKTKNYDYLDDPSVTELLVDFRDENTTKVTWLLPQMHCSSCIWLLEHLYKINYAIFSSKVNFLRKEISLRFHHHDISLRQIATLLDEIGYAPAINLADLEKRDDPNRQTIDRSLTYKIGLAGFAFGNIMLLSFPEYLGLDKESDKTMYTVFGYFNLILGIPVLLYSARDYITSAWQGIKRRHLNIDVPLALGIFALFFRSAYEILSGAGAGFMDSFAALIFLLLTGKWFQQKTYYHLSFERDYKSYFPISATVRSKDHDASRAVNLLEIGDTILVRNQEIIPADGVILKGAANIDYSFVTGEAEPVARASGEKVFAGGRQIGEAIEVTLTKKVSQSYLTQLWNSEVFKETKSPISLLADKAGRYFTAVVLVVSTVAFFYWLPQNMGIAVDAATAVLIIACPCAVALAIPFTMGNILRIFGRNDFYLKNTAVLEGFDGVDAVVFDKTGTITRRMDSSIEMRGNFTNKRLHIVKSLTRHSNHPLSRQLFDFIESDEKVLVIKNFEERTGEGLYGEADGKKVVLGSRSWLKANGIAAQQMTNFDSHTEGGVWVALDNELIGYFIFKNMYREGFENVVQFFKKEGKTLYVLSGDNEREREYLTTYFEKNNLYFNQNPQDKLNFVKKLQNEGKKVLMLGDGLNDAGALRQSDVGIVISENTNNFSPACDGILHAKRFADLPNLVTLAKGGTTIVNRAYKIAFLYNIVGLSYAVSGNLLPVIAAILMPLSAATIVLFGVISGNLRARKKGFLLENTGF